MKIVFALVLSMAAVAFCAQPVSASKSAGRKGVAQMIPDSVVQRQVYKMTGGMLKKPGVQKGEIVYVNAQKLADRSWLVHDAEAIAKVTKTAARVVDGAFDVRKPMLVGNVTVFIVDDPALPMSLIAPEGRWAVMNVSGIRSDKQPFFRARFKKELTRVFSMACGAASSSYPGSLLGPITAAEQLDKFPDCKLPYDVNERFEPYLEGLGVVPYKLVSYRRACLEGWAPAPTNDIQRAVMEKAKASKK